MARCGCGSGCGCTLVAGENVTVTGNGTESVPYVISADETEFTGGDNITIEDGVISSPTNCPEVRDCFSAGENVTITEDGVISAQGAGDTVQTGCGITGDGTESSPLTIDTTSWPYDCPPEDEGTAIACDADGLLRGMPEHTTYYEQLLESRDHDDVAVPSGDLQEVDLYTLTITNPDPCRSVRVMFFREVDVDFNLPPGGTAAYGIESDTMYAQSNGGANTITNQHVQTAKYTNTEAALAPGDSLDMNVSVRVGRGEGGATYDRTQVAMRVLMITNS